MPQVLLTRTESPKEALRQTTLAARTARNAQLANTPLCGYQAQPKQQYCNEIHQAAPIRFSLGVLRSSYTLLLDAFRLLKLFLQKWSL